MSVLLNSSGLGSHFSLFDLRVDKSKLFLTIDFDKWPFLNRSFGVLND